MRHALFVLLILALPAQAQTAPEADEGADLLGQGMRAIIEGLAQQMEPALQDMGEALTKLRPMAEELLRLVDDIGNYEAPVVLENGDILIRRKPAPPEPLKEGEIEL